MKNTNSLSSLAFKIIFSFLLLIFCLLTTIYLPQVFAARETLSIETYYPAPYGSFFEIKAVGKTELATDSSGVAIGELWDAGDAKLEVEGTINASGAITQAGTGVSLTGHTHSYAGSPAPDGPANSANDLTCVGCVTLGTETAGAYDTTVDTIADDGTITLGAETTGAYDTTVDTIADDGTITLGAETTGNYVSLLNSSTGNLNIVGGAGINVASGGGNITITASGGGVGGGGSGGTSGSGSSPAAGYVAKWLNATDLGNSNIYDKFDGTNRRVGIGTETPGSELDIRGTQTIRSGALRFADDNGSIYLDNWIGMANNIDGSTKWLHIGGITEAGYRRLALYADRILLAGNVGIGTASPVDKLDIRGNVSLGRDAANELTLRSPSAGGNNSYVAWYNGPTRQAYMGWEPTYLNLRLENGYNFGIMGGNVGIGTATPGQKLHVEGAIAADTLESRNSTDPLEINYYTGAPTKICATAFCGVVSAYFAPTTGNVGIGTASPNYALEVKPGGTTGNVALFKGNPWASAGNTSTIYLGDTNHYFQAKWGGPFTIDSTDNIVIQPTGGSVFIGTTTTSPFITYGLKVAGRILGESDNGEHAIYGKNSSTGIGVDGNSSSGYGVHGSSYSSYGVHGWSANSYGVYGHGDLASGGGVHGDGYVGVKGTSSDFFGSGVFGINSSWGGYGVQCQGAKCGGNRAWTNTSDERLKKDIVTIPDALQKTLQLRGVNFKWKEENKGDEKLRMGLIAQEALKVVPEIVTQNTDGYYSMETGSLTALLVEAVKEQQKEIASQKLAMTQQGKEIEAIRLAHEEDRRRIEELEKRIK